VITVFSSKLANPWDNCFKNSVLDFVEAETMLKGSIIWADFRMDILKKIDGSMLGHSI